MRASRSSGATPKAKQGGGSLLLLFAVRAARQLAMIHLPTAADASHPTTYPWDHSPSAQEVSVEVVPGRDQALRPVLATVE